MNTGIVFVPKIAYSFAALKTVKVIAKPVSEAATQEYNTFTDKELTLLVNLKAIGMSYRDIGKLIHRSQDSCSLTMSRKDLKWVYKDIRNQMIDGVMG